jgi:hypothetical protein
MGKRDMKTAMFHFEQAEKSLTDPVKLKKIKEMKEEMESDHRKQLRER